MKEAERREKRRAKDQAGKAVGTLLGVVAFTKWDEAAYDKRR